MIITIALFDIQSYWPCLWRLPGLFIIGKAVCVSLNVPSISGGQSCRSWGLEKLRSWLRALAVHSYVKHGRLSNKFTEISILIWEVQPLILFVVYLQEVWTSDLLAGYRNSHVIRYANQVSISANEGTHAIMFIQEWQSLFSNNLQTNTHVKLKNFIAWKCISVI